MNKTLVIFAMMTLATTAFANNLKDRDAELTRVYNQVLNLAKKDPVVTRKIRDAQRAWVKYRDAQIEMWCPPKPYGAYSVPQSVCFSTVYQKLTAKRIKDWKDWLKEPEEGDLCARRFADPDN